MHLCCLTDRSVNCPDEVSDETELASRRTRSEYPLAVIVAKRRLPAKCAVCRSQLADCWLLTIRLGDAKWMERVQKPL